MVFLPLIGNERGRLVPCLLVGTECGGLATHILNINEWCGLMSHLFSGSKTQILALTRANWRCDGDFPPFNLLNELHTKHM